MEYKNLLDFPGFLLLCLFTELLFISVIYLFICYSPQIFWREEIAEQLQKFRSKGSHIPQLEEELVRRRKEELR